MPLPLHLLPKDVQLHLRAHAHAFAREALMPTHGVDEYERQGYERFVEMTPEQRQENLARIVRDSSSGESAAIKAFARGWLNALYRLFPGGLPSRSVSRPGAAPRPPAPAPRSWREIPVADPYGRADITLYHNGVVEGFYYDSRYPMQPRIHAAVQSLDNYNEDAQADMVEDVVIPHLKTLGDRIRRAAPNVPALARALLRQAMDPPGVTTSVPSTLGSLRSAAVGRDVEIIFWPEERSTYGVKGAPKAQYEAVASAHLDAYGGAIPVAITTSYDTTSEEEAERIIDRAVKLADGRAEALYAAIVNAANGDRAEHEARAALDELLTDARNQLAKEEADVSAWVYPTDSAPVKTWHLNLSSRGTKTKGTVKAEYWDPEFMITLHSDNGVCKFYSSIPSGKAVVQVALENLNRKAGDRLLTLLGSLDILFTEITDGREARQIITVSDAQDIIETQGEIRTILEGALSSPQWAARSQQRRSEPQAPIPIPAIPTLGKDLPGIQLLRALAREGLPSTTPGAFEPEEVLGDNLDTDSGLLGVAEKQLSDWYADDQITEDVSTVNAALSAIASWVQSYAQAFPEFKVTERQIKDALRATLERFNETLQEAVNDSKDEAKDDINKAFNTIDLYLGMLDKATHRRKDVRDAMLEVLGWIDSYKAVQQGGEDPYLNRRYASGLDAASRGMLREALIKEFRRPYERYATAYEDATGENLHIRDEGPDTKTASLFGSGRGLFAGPSPLTDQELVEMMHQAVRGHLPDVARYTPMEDTKWRQAIEAGWFTLTYGHPPRLSAQGRIRYQELRHLLPIEVEYAEGVGTTYPVKKDDVEFTKETTTNGRKRLEARIKRELAPAWHTPEVRIEQTYGISKYGATKGQRTGPADMWDVTLITFLPHRAETQIEARVTKQVAKASALKTLMGIRYEKRVG